jgi:hypothetical protein
VLSRQRRPSYHRRNRRMVESKAGLPRRPRGRGTPLTRIWMVVLSGYLVVAGGLVLVRIIELATAEHS